MREFYIEKRFNRNRDRLSFWVLKMGGINYQREYLKGELNMIREESIGRFLINKNGNGYTLDKLSLMAVDEGFLNPDSSLNDFLNLLLDDLRGQKIYSIFREIPNSEIEKKAEVHYGNL